MQATDRQQQYAKVAALAAAGILAAGAVMPALPRPSWMSVVQRDLRLTADGDSLLNVPINFLQDLVNVPYNEIQAFNSLGVSLINSGSWWDPSATNIWGEDPGDPPHFMAAIASAIPFSAISGQYSPEPGYVDPSDPTGPDSFNWADAAAGHLGLGQQITLLADAEIPVSASSDADWSAPLLPATPITGLTGPDSQIFFLASLLGLQNYPLFTGWDQTPISDLTTGDYVFPTAVNPSYGVGPGGAVPTDTVFQSAGTHTATTANVPAADLTELEKPVSEGGSGYTVATPEQVGTVSPAGATIDDGDILNTHGDPVQLMPWSNEPFTLNLAYPFENFANSLQEPFNASGFDIPSLDDIAHAFQNFLAGSLIAFDPIVPGNPFCGVGCNDPASFISMIQGINNMYPGDTALQHWIDLAQQQGPSLFGMTNAPTLHQSDLVQTMFGSPYSMFDLGNASPDDPPANVDTPIAFDISPSMQGIIDVFKAAGAQNFTQLLATLVGYQPLDIDSLTPVNEGFGTAGTAAADAADAPSAAADSVAATTPDDPFTDLLSSMGLSDLANLL